MLSGQALLGLQLMMCTLSLSLSVVPPHIGVPGCSTSLTSALRNSGAQAQCKLYKGKTHTDLIVQVLCHALTVLQGLCTLCILSYSM